MGGGGGLVNDFLNFVIIKKSHFADPLVLVLVGMIVAVIVAAIMVVVMMVVMVEVVV